MNANYICWNIRPTELQRRKPFQKLLHIISYGLLAPSAHNSQPWECRVGGRGNRIEVWIAPERLLQESDPDMRQAYISLGAFIENICVAAQAYGAQVMCDYVLQNRHVATIYFVWRKATGTCDTQALANIVRRCSNRHSYTSHPIDAALLQEARCYGNAKIHFVSASEQKQAIASLAAAADTALMTPPFKRELATWVHPNWTHSFTGMPASVQGIPGPVSAFVKSIIRKTPIEKGQAKKDIHRLRAAPLIAIVTSHTDSRAAWLNAGRTYEQLCLAATKHGIAMETYASPIEYKEARSVLRTFLPLGNLPLCLLRLGYTAKVPPRTPRLPAGRIVITE